MKNLIFHKSFKAVALSLLLITSLWGCEEQNIDVATTSDVNMLGYFEKNADQFSSLIQILEKTEVAGFLSAYGSYTMFAPTNEAIDVFLKEKGVTSVDQLEADELKRIVRFHLVEDTIATSEFTDGKLPSITMLGQYVITGAELENGVARTRVNRQANVVQANIRVGNGIVHSIDRVLQPASQTVGQMLESNPEYSIFTTALKQTGLFNQLNGANTQTGWYTVLAQKNSVYQSMGITNYEELKAKYSQTGNPADKSDSLYLNMSYRILNDSKYLADLVTAPSHATLAPQEVITSMLKGEQVLINEDVFNGVREEGALVDRRASDNTATNGVLHTVTENFQIKKRNPVRVYFDVADQPEIRILPAFRRSGAPGVAFPIGSLKDVLVEGSNNPTITYRPGSTGDADGYAYRDYLEVRMSANVARVVEFTTPTIVKGRYRVWVAFRTILRTSPLQVYFNGQVLPRTIDMSLYYPGGNERELLAQGIKRHVSDTPGNSYARLAGTVTVETTGRHKIRFQGLTNDNGVHRIDMIQFIPEDQDQLFPKIARDGTLVQEQ
ncbi:fasciclin domain-containing protein [Rufibacter sp. XAAS-G3-1]|uniref:fasciclin domain-containing protein n=1 Tax=Rufibacter sp. XAAS-G3-1 TaxID=2729134 RepID=UPI0015E6FD15|nr:fasciclin domain-containing protein [Rufibacter sp. XAAS-G3-1]